jgi:hypothetical protein
MIELQSNQPNVNDPDIRFKMLEITISKIGEKIKWISEQQRLFCIGCKTEYDSKEEICVDIDFQISKIETIRTEIRFISYNRKYNLPYSLN